MNKTLLFVAIALCLLVLGDDVYAAARSANDIRDAGSAAPWYQFVLDFFRSSGCSSCHMEYS